MGKRRVGAFWLRTEPLSSSLPEMEKQRWGSVVPPPAPRGGADLATSTVCSPEGRATTLYKCREEFRQILSHFLYKVFPDILLTLPNDILERRTHSTCCITAHVQNRSWKKGGGRREERGGGGRARPFLPPSLRQVPATGGSRALTPPLGEATARRGPPPSLSPSPTLQVPIPILCFPEFRERITRRSRVFWSCQGACELLEVQCVRWVECCDRLAEVERGGGGGKARVARSLEIRRFTDGYIYFHWYYTVRVLIVELLKVRIEAALWKSGGWGKRSFSGLRFIKTN